LSVLPDYQGKGIGSFLQKESIKKAKTLGSRAVIIFGDPVFFHRFGYRNAEAYHIQTADGKNMDAFMALDLQGNGLPAICGRFHASDAVKFNNEKVEAFDQRLLPKEKGTPRHPIGN